MASPLFTGSLTGGTVSALSAPIAVADGGTGTATPSLIAGTGVASITGTWPNQTINVSAGGGGGVSSLNSLTGALSIAVGLGLSVSAGGSSVTLAQKGSTTAVRSTVAGTTTSTTLLAANTNRLGATIFNDQSGAAANLYVAVGSSGSTTDFTYELGPGQTAEIPYGYTGIIWGVWSAATGNARITEFT